MADENGAYAHVRAGLADRLLEAQSTLPPGYRFLVIEAFRPMSLQIAHFEAHVTKLRAAYPTLTTPTLQQMASRYICPPAVDLTPVRRGRRRTVAGYQSQRHRHWVTPWCPRGW